MSTSSNWIAIIAAAVVFALPAPAHAAPILTIDQQSFGTVLSASVGSAIGNGFGQSFTPTLSRVDAFEFEVISSSSTTARLDIFEGEGFAG